MCRPREFAKFAPPTRARTPARDPGRAGVAKGGALFRHLGSLLRPPAPLILSESLPRTRSGEGADYLTGAGV